MEPTDNRQMRENRNNLIAATKKTGSTDNKYIDERRKKMKSK